MKRAILSATLALSGLVSLVNGSYADEASKLQLGNVKESVFAHTGEVNYTSPIRWHYWTETSKDDYSVRFPKDYNQEETIAYIEANKDSLEHKRKVEEFADSAEFIELRNGDALGVFVSGNEVSYKININGNIHVYSQKDLPGKLLLNRERNLLGLVKMTQADFDNLKDMKN